MSCFADQVVVLTGASEGIGRALALQLADQGATLVLAARDRARLSELAALCQQRGARALAVPTDVSEEPQCAALVATALGQFGRIDMLIANAGASMWSRLDELRDLQLLERLMRVNYLGAAWLAWHALPALKQARGRIVAVSSVSGLAGLPTRTAYCASKHAMMGFFESLRIELLEHGVSVTLIAPDFVVSEIHRRATGPDGQPLRESPMQESRIMTAEACARIILRAAAARRRLAFTSVRGSVLRWVKLLAPGLVDRMAARAIRLRR